MIISYLMRTSQRARVVYKSEYDKPLQHIGALGNFILLSKIIRHITNNESLSFRVMLEGYPITDLSRYVDTFGRSVEFKQAVSILEFDVSWLNKKNKNGNTILNRYFKNHLQDILSTIDNKLVV